MQLLSRIFVLIILILGTSVYSNKLLKIKLEDAKNLEKLINKKEPNHRFPNYASPVEFCSKKTQIIMFQYPITMKLIGKLGTNDSYEIDVIQSTSNIYLCKNETFCLPFLPKYLASNRYKLPLTTTTDDIPSNVVLCISKNGTVVVGNHWRWEIIDQFFTNKNKKTISLVVDLELSRFKPEDTKACSISLQQNDTFFDQYGSKWKIDFLELKENSNNRSSANCIYTVYMTGKVSNNIESNITENSFQFHLNREQMFTIGVLRLRKQRFYDIPITKVVAMKIISILLASSLLILISYVAVVILTHYMTKRNMIKEMIKRENTSTRNEENGGIILESNQEESMANSRNISNSYSKYLSNSYSKYVFDSKHEKT
ncbi:hypothetical protein SNEBB_006928 [Seison nebaliae]|nr:hypothetical protein SNEBB_006928 [Seison nebaliae]